MFNLSHTNQVQVQAHFQKLQLISQSTIHTYCNANRGVLGNGIRDTKRTTNDIKIK